MHNRKVCCKATTILVAAIVVGSSWLLGAHAPGQVSSKGDPAAFDEAGVRAAVAQRTEGRRKLDAHLSAEAFAVDAVWINAFGRRTTGRAAIEKFLSDLYADPGYAQREVFVPPQIEDILFVRPDVAVVRTFTRNAGQRLPNGTVLAERRTHNTMTLTRESAGWKVRYEVVTDERSPSPQP
jgi:uncharacterized protein (TIGR02246 family)